MLTRSRKRRLESEKQSPAAEAIAGSEDLVREILLRLPVKSLLRFESVSKKWLSLISDPDFAQSYTHRYNPNNKPSGLLLNHGYSGFQFIPFDDDDQARTNLLSQDSTVSFLCPDDPGSAILQSCNGLLLCVACDSTSWKKNDRYKDYYICNPTTKQYRIHRFLYRRFGAYLVAVNLAFDPLKSPHYKLICIREMEGQSLERDLIYRIDIYSSETYSMKPSSASRSPLTFTVPQGYESHCSVYFARPVYCNGAIHWYSENDTCILMSIQSA